MFGERQSATEVFLGKKRHKKITRHQKLNIYLKIETVKAKAEGSPYYLLQELEPLA